MSQLSELIKELNIDPSKLTELSAAMTNPFMAMQKIQELGIPMEFFQKAMMIMMTNPDALTEFAKEMGASEEMANQAKEMAQRMMKPDESE